MIRETRVRDWRKSRAEPAPLWALKRKYIVKQYTFHWVLSAIIDYWLILVIYIVEIGNGNNTGSFFLPVLIFSSLIVRSSQNQEFGK